MDANVPNHRVSWGLPHHPLEHPVARSMTEPVIPNNQASFMLLCSVQKQVTMQETRPNLRPLRCGCSCAAAVGTFCPIKMQMLSKAVLHNGPIEVSPPGGQRSACKFPQCPVQKTSVSGLLMCFSEVVFTQLKPAGSAVSDAMMKSVP